jgi:hypothetical protein
MRVVNSFAVWATILAAAAAACSQDDTANQTANRVPSIEEQRLAERDPIHRSYNHVLRAAYNLRSCERDEDAQVVSVLSDRKQVESVARTKGFGPAMTLAERIVLFEMQGELHAKCQPDFATALTATKNAIEDFRKQVDRSPARPA